VFVRTKVVKGIEYHYLVRGIRVDGRVQQKVLLYLGRHRSVSEAYQYWQNQRETPGLKTHAKKMMRRLKPYL
jgi:hypothetical protein